MAPARVRENRMKHIPKNHSIVKILAHIYAYHIKQIVQKGEEKQKKMSLEKMNERMNEKHSKMKIH